MSAKENTVVSTDLTAAREIDFVTRFTNEIGVLKDILGTSRVEVHEAGTKITAKKASVTLNSTPVGEGEEIPYNEVDYTDVEVGTLTWDKQAIGVSIEAISKRGYNGAIQAADDDMLYKQRTNIVNAFMTFAQTGQLTPTVEEAATITTFQMALAYAQGLVQSKWEDLGKGFSGVVGFCNTLDAYKYLGAASITAQEAFGMQYIENFLGYSKLFLTSKMPSGKVVATPEQNIVLYYVDASTNDFSKAGFEFRTDGQDNLIAVHVEGNHKTMVSELTTVSGISLYAEYLDGIAVVEVNP